MNRHVYQPELGGLDSCVAEVELDGVEEECGLPRNSPWHNLGNEPPVVYYAPIVIEAVIAELERLGYTVIDPDSHLPRMVRATETSRTIGSSAQDAVTIINAFLKEPK